MHIERDSIGDQELFTRGSVEVTEAFVASFAPEGTLRHRRAWQSPFPTSPACPCCCAPSSGAGQRCEIVPGMPRATLSAAIAMPLIPLPPAPNIILGRLVEIMARLRRGCPWDREQTHESLVPYLIEETYEVVEAIEETTKTNSAKSWATCSCKSSFIHSSATERGDSRSPT